MGKPSRNKIGRIALAVAVTALVALGIERCFLTFPPMHDDDTAIPEDALKGIDVSGHNGDVDFEQVASQGYRFAFIKATEGTDFKDRQFVDNIRKAREAGLMVGAYHFFRFDTDGDLQATNFMNSIRGRDLDFPAVIDVEEWGNPDGNATSQIINRLRQMIERMEYFGHEIILYTNKDSYARFIRGNFDNYPLWICSFKPVDDNIDWEIWQYTHSGHVDGIHGKVDLNVLRDKSISKADTINARKLR